MVFLLTEDEKFYILIFASSLFLLSVIITVCVVSPICYFHRWLFKSRNRKTNPTKSSPKQQLLKPTLESKHFQLTVVPHYGTSTSSSTSGANGSAKPSKEPKPKKAKEASRKKKEGTSLAEAAAKLPHPGQIKLSLVWEKVDDNGIKLRLTLNQVNSLPLRGYGVEPACYVTLDVIVAGGSRTRRKSINNKVAASFKTTTSKRCLNPVFDEAFECPLLPKSILKDGVLKVKVMDDERYANDCCIGEITLPLKQFAIICNEEQVAVYGLNDPKDFKGDLLIGLCYLPTSRRVTITVFKGTLVSQINPHQNYYVRILMFINGKLTKKKKTPTSEKLMWGDNETMTFELTNIPPDEISFMLVLSSSTDSSTSNVSSPSSPETPETPESTHGSRKERHIGHFVVGEECWAEMKQEPRKQISKWVKLA